MTTQELRRLHMALVLFAYVFAFQQNTWMTAILTAFGILFGIAIHLDRWEAHAKTVLVVYLTLVGFTKILHIGDSLPLFYFVHFSNAIFAVLGVMDSEDSITMEVGLNLSLCALSFLGASWMKDASFWMIACMIFGPFACMGVLKWLYTLQKHRRNQKLVIKSNV